MTMERRARPHSGMQVTFDHYTPGDGTKKYTRVIRDVIRRRDSNNEPDILYSVKVNGQVIWIRPSDIILEQNDDE